VNDSYRIFGVKAAPSAKGLNPGAEAAPPHRIIDRPVHTAVRPTRPLSGPRANVDQWLAAGSNASPLGSVGLGVGPAVVLPPQISSLLPVQTETEFRRPEGMGASDRQRLVAGL